MERMGGVERRDNNGYTSISSKERKYWFVSHESMLEWRFAVYHAHLTPQSAKFSLANFGRQYMKYRKMEFGN